MTVRVLVEDGEPLSRTLQRLRTLIQLDGGYPVYAPPWWKKRYDRFEKPSIIERRGRLRARQVRRSCTAADEPASRGGRRQGRRRPDRGPLDPWFVEVLGRCRFTVARFVPYAALVALEANEAGYIASMPYRGGPFDRSRLRLVPGGWDHEHCLLCKATIQEDDVYWKNLGPDHVELCDACYTRDGPRWLHGRPGGPHEPA